MAQAQVIQGSGVEVAAHLQRFLERKNVLLIIPDEPSSVSGDPSEDKRMIQFGLFPQLRGLTEEDFKSAEWSDEEEASPE